VNGHQNKSINPSELPFQSQLNIQADVSATSFQGRSNHATAKGPLIPGPGCHLVIERQHLPSHHRRKLRTRRGHHQLLQYIQHKHRLSDVAMTHINWESHAQAIRNFQVTSTTFLVKFLSKWPPVGKQVHYIQSLAPSKGNLQLRGGTKLLNVNRADSLLGYSWSTKLVCLVLNSTITTQVAH
jgi:hypothetical protein